MIDAHLGTATCRLMGRRFSPSSLESGGGRPCTICLAYAHRSCCNLWQTQGFLVSVMTSCTYKPPVFGFDAYGAIGRRTTLDTYLGDVVYYIRNRADWQPEGTGRFASPD